MVAEVVAGQTMVGAAWSLVAALAFALLSCLHLIWPRKVKRGTDFVARQFGTLWYTSRFGESYYRLVGWVYLVCAAAILLGAGVLLAR